MATLDSGESDVDHGRGRWEPKGFCVFRRLLRFFLWGYVIASASLYLFPWLETIAAATVVAIVMLVGAACSWLGMVLTAPTRRDRLRRRRRPDPAIDDERAKL